MDENIKQGLGLVRGQRWRGFGDGHAERVLSASLQKHSGRNGEEATCICVLYKT